MLIILPDKKTTAEERLGNAAILRISLRRRRKLAFSDASFDA